jgi:hypothetical protein
MDGMKVNMATIFQEGVESRGNLFNAFAYNKTLKRRPIFHTGTLGTYISRRVPFVKAALLQKRVAATKAVIDLTMETTILTAVEMLLVVILMFRFLAFCSLQIQFVARMCDESVSCPGNRSQQVLRHTLLYKSPMVLLNTKVNN